MAQGKWYIIVHRPKTSGKHSQKQTRKKCLPLPLESIKTIVTSQVKTIVTTLPAPQQDPDQNTTKASKPAACTTANHNRHRPKTWEWCETKTKVSPIQQHKQQTNTNKQQQQKQTTQKPTRHLVRRVKHYAFRKVPMPLSTAPRWNSRYHS